MSVAFKEWQVVCDALASGKQSILLRKGGIHEGREGFRFEHGSFLLFPTKFHAQNEHVREGTFSPGQEWQVGDAFEITHQAEVLFTVTLNEWEKVEALYPFHIYTHETLKERFDWEGKGMAAGSIHVALVRVTKLDPILNLPYETRFGGCRSWVEIPKDNLTDLSKAVPVIEDESFSKLSEEIREIMGYPNPTHS